jgi:hypothetical protein
MMGTKLCQSLSQVQGGKQQWERVNRSEGAMRLMIFAALGAAIGVAAFKLICRYRFSRPCNEYPILERY